MAEVTDVDVEQGELEAVSEQIQQEETRVEPPKVEDDVPEEFKGKSAAELARIAQHARREMGKMGNELGEVRRLADELIKSQLKPKVEAEQPKEVDFFENPQEAIRRAVETNPAVVQAQQYAVNAQRAMAKQQFQQMHPDAGQIIQDPEFAEFVKGSKIRQQLLVAADQSYDLDAANELFSTFKQLKTARQAQQAEAQTKAQEVEKTARNESIRAAAVDTGGSGESSKKIWRRIDLLNMQIRDRARYEAMQDEIVRAYQEGRVR